MWLDSSVKSQEDIISMFDAVADGLILIDAVFKVKMINSKAKDILNIDDTATFDQPAFCYQLICKNDAVCSDCPINNNNEEGELSTTLTIEDKEGQKAFLKARYTPWYGYNVLTIKDITKEVKLLRKFDLTRKEAEAKNILLERRLNKSQEENNRIREIIDHVPGPVVAINDQLKITNQNKASINCFDHESIDNCYQLFGFDEQCENCPLIIDGNNSDDGDLKKIQLVNGKYFTERIVTNSNDDGGVLFFSDTTKQIQLIEEIRLQQHTLTGLVDIAAIMQQENDIEGVLQFFLDIFTNIIQTKTIILLIDEVRIGSLWLNYQREITESDVAIIVRDYLSRKNINTSNVLLSHNSFTWSSVTQITLFGGHGKRVGYMAFPGEISKELQNKISLFTESIGAYIHNKQLMRQLEEKANTDQLTGLYNRGYLQRAIDQEREKSKKFAIHYAIVAIDINRLKMANDTYGHVVGDNLIMEVANRLRQSIRKTDVLARVGGDEFILLLTDTQDHAAQLFVERLQNEVFNDAFLVIEGGESFNISVSIGAAGSDLYPYESLADTADARMYKDKKLFYSKEKRYR